MRSADERQGVVDLNAQEVVEMEAFNQFIDSIKVMEKFIWFRPNGQSMSRLDRLLGLIACSGFWTGTYLITSL